MCYAYILFCACILAILVQPKLVTSVILKKLKRKYHKREKETVYFFLPRYEKREVGTWDRKRKTPFCGGRDRGRQREEILDNDLSWHGGMTTQFIHAARDGGL